MTGTTRWRLKSVKIRNFRGVADEQVYDFDGGPGLLHGNNGVGKSTAAQCIQWTIYGKFPSEVLQNTAFNGFMSPVSASAATWHGQVTLVSGNREMLITRDHKSKTFSIEIDDATYTGAEAEAQRDKLLGVDEAGFVRTVLLHQSRIRGLLLDSPKDRNAALDRLLGMDDIENIFARLKPRDFAKAAEAHREDVHRAQRDHEAQERLLVNQRDEAQRQARAYKFLNKDFNSAGLKKSFAEIDKKLQAIAAKYEVAMEPLPTCSDAREAPAVSAEVDSALRTVRAESSLQRKLTEIDTAISRYSTLKKSFGAAASGAATIRKQREDWLQAHGKQKDVVSRHAQLEKDLEGSRITLKAAGELRQLLVDARQLLEHSPSDACPVCEQSVASASELVSSLSTRLDSMTSDEIAELEKRVSDLANELARTASELKEFDQQEALLKEAQQHIDTLREQVVEALGGKGISETKVDSRLDEAMHELSRKREELAQGAAAMENSLSEVQEEDRRVRDGLVPVLKSRMDLARLEDDWKKAQESHVEAEAAAGRLETVADQMAELRAALLDAKNELATSTLSDASPRADELYRTLVRHPVFDSLKITTAPRANKIDYSFEVSSEGKKKTTREARLVLSDGQVTATAIGLFFALSDANTHNLDLLYVDDPTQNLDLPCKEAMAKVVTEIATRRQVIVSTQDEDFVSFLEAEGFFDRAVVHHLERWDGNPVVKTRMAG